MASADFVGKKYTVYRSNQGVTTATEGALRELGPQEVLVRITHTGVCHTDTTFCRLGAPLALGHEGVGIVEAVGSLVTQFKIGDRAGGGFHKDSCGHCKYCLSGNDIWCYDRVEFGEGDYNNGTFSEYYIGKEGFLHRIPEGLKSEHAAPLQCAGATVYSALKATVDASTRVGILGIGGLGHLAIQYAAKMGADVVVYSTSTNKETEAREFGAKEFYLLDEMIEKQKTPVDVLVIAGTKYPDWSKVLAKNFLARNGTIIPLAAPVHGNLSLPADALFWQGYHVHSTLVASKGVHDEMLEFSARNNVLPLIQVTKHTGADSIEAAFKSMEENKVRYRAVLEF